MKRKLQSQSGESIAETLISMLIVAVTFTFLTGAVVSAARVNAKLKAQDVSFQSDAPETLTDYTITVASAGTDLLTLNDASTDPDVTLHRTENGYYYYEIQEAEAPTEP